MSDRKGSRERKRNRSSSKGESVQMYWNETVYLSGLLPLKPGQTMAAGFLRRTGLRNALCEVMETWDASQRSDATILCGVSTY